MLVRYIKQNEQHAEELAKIYTIEEHGIKKDYIDYDAKKIIHRLKSHGYQAFIVGGAIRDLLIGRKPKDFDIVTDAHPGKIHKIFWNSRIIGRRFRLVHVYSGNKITEVSTFRSSDLSKSNSFGTMKEDVMRRDFTFNALYYCPEQEYLYDYVGGFDDIIDKSVRPIMPLDRIFIDDPVRIIRAVRYSMITGFPVKGKFKRYLCGEASGLNRIPSSRITEEIIKILNSGRSEKILHFLQKNGILRHLLPNLHEIVTQRNGVFSVGGNKSRFYGNLRQLDNKRQKQRDLPRGEIFAWLMEAFIQLPQKASHEEVETAYKEVFRTIKHLIKPITPPNRDIEQAVRIIFKKKGLSPPKRRRYGKPHRRN